MNARQFMNQPDFFLELGQESLRVACGEQTLELSLDRAVDGSLTDACKNEVTARLQKFITRKNWQPRARVYCAIGARGVSLRRLTLPTDNKDEVQKLLPFQIEREFPLSPDQLAWGAQLVHGANTGPLRQNGNQELLVVAVKKDTLEEYAAILANCGAVPVFTLAALDRTYVCPQPPGPYALLAVERTYSELITMDSGVPLAVRVLAWGRDDLASIGRSIRPASSEVAVGSASTASFGGSLPAVPEPPATGLDALVRLLQGQALGRVLYLAGLPEIPGSSDIASQLAIRLGGGIECRQVEMQDSRGAGAAVLGLQRAVERHAGSLPLVLQLNQVTLKSKIPPREQLKWAAIAVGLLVLALLLPYAEALLLKGHLANKLLAIKSDQSRLAVIDRELDFLQYLQANQPPYLDAMLVLAKSAPQGTRFDSMSMNRRGEVSLRGSLRDGQQVADLRSKLLASGFFASVAVEEQAPTPDRQKVNVRITALWKPIDSRTTPSAEPPAVPGQTARAGTPAPATPLPGPAAPLPTPNPTSIRQGKR